MPFVSRFAWQWWTYRTHFERRACPAVGCRWRGPQEDCPDHGIGAYYRRRSLTTNNGGTA
jgi:hypothetical protein